LNDGNTLDEVWPRERAMRLGEELAPTLQF
jgi:hypothetical protein